MSKELLFSLSKKAGDFVVTAACSSGPGGQNVNNRHTKVRIVHPDSGAVGESQTHRTQEANRRAAFQRLTNSKRFRDWVRIEATRRGFISEQVTGKTNVRKRTYNAPRDEVINHETGLHVNGFSDVLDGKLDVLIEDGLRHRAAEA